MEERAPHIPVLLHTVSFWAKLHEGCKAIDATIGFGGHASELLKSLGSDGRYLGIDKDVVAVKYCSQEFANDQRVIVVSGQFSQIETIARENDFANVDMVLFDLGVSSFQLDNPKYGLSFTSDEPLDMRIGVNGPNAAAVINTWDAGKLRELFTENGVEKANRIISSIIETRSKHHISTTKELVDLIENAAGRTSKIHPATKIFQALRIEANDEINELKSGLENALQLLKVGGRLLVISFHSGEDQMVKDFMKQESSGCICPPEYPVCKCDHKASIKILTAKPIVPDTDEVRSNPRSRSAKLRVAEKI